MQLLCVYALQPRLVALHPRRAQRDPARHHRCRRASPAPGRPPLPSQARDRRRVVADWFPVGLTLFLAPSWPWLIPGLIIFGVVVRQQPRVQVLHLPQVRALPRRRATSRSSSAPTLSGLVVAPLRGRPDRRPPGHAHRLSHQHGRLRGVVHPYDLPSPRHAALPSAETPWTPRRSLRRNRRFRRYLVVLLRRVPGAVYVGQAFINPYLSQVHAPGVRGPRRLLVAGRPGRGACSRRRWGARPTATGPRVGIAGVLVCLLADGLSCCSWAGIPSSGRWRWCAAARSTRCASSPP